MSFHYWQWPCSHGAVIIQSLFMYGWIHIAKLLYTGNAKCIVSFKVRVLRCSADVEPSNDMTCSTWFRCHNITYVGHDQESYLLVVYTITLSQSNQHYNKNCTPINVDDGPYNILTGHQKLHKVDMLIKMYCIKLQIKFSKGNVLKCSIPMGDKCRVLKYSTCTVVFVVQFL